MKVYFTSLGVLLFSSMSFGQIGINPQLGVENQYRFFETSLADTGTVGINQIWNYSNIEPDPMSLYSITYRSPNSEELLLDPNIDFVEQSLSGEINMYGINADSIFTIGFVDGTSGEYIPYSNPNVMYRLPVQLNNSQNQNSFGYEYNFGIQTNVLGENNWKVTGNGTLLTPYGIYEHAIKVSRYLNYDFFVEGSLFLQTTALEITFFDADFSKPLLTIQNVEYFDLSSAYVYFDNNGLEVQDIDEVGKNHFYPNPANDILYLDQNVVSYEIYSQDGKLVLSGENQTELNVNSLVNGNYVITLKTVNGVIHEKLMIN